MKTSATHKALAAFSLLTALSVTGQASAADTQTLDSAIRNKNITVVVEIDGSLPGFSRDQLLAYVSQQMTNADVTAWHYQPISMTTTGGDQPSNRVVWHFTQLPFAGGGMRYIGPALSKAREAFGVGRAVGIDAKIYLNDRFQATTFDQVTITGGADDPKLATELQKIMKSIVANAFAGGPANVRKLAGLPAVKTG